MKGTNSRAAKLLGSGLRFPVMPHREETQRAEDGFSTITGLLFAKGRELVRQSIWLILATEPGERIMRPDFGCGLMRYIMKPNTAAVRALIQRDVEAAIRTWEPRVQLEEVLVQPGEDPALVHITIKYRHVVDASPDILVYPFYLE